MTSLRTALLAALFVLPACSSFAPSEEPASVESAEGELRSVATGFFVRAPLSGRRLEAFRRALEDGDMGFAWVRNQGNVEGLQWEGPAREALTDVQRATLVRAAFAFRGRKGVRDLAPVATDDAALGAALDAIGLSESSPDDATLAEREKLFATLREVARTRTIHVLAATLHDQVDMYWEGALVVVDEENRQILIATGGYGT